MSTQATPSLLLLPSTWGTDVHSLREISRGLIFILLYKYELSTQISFHILNNPSKSGSILDGMALE